jgi:CRISPR/Cas system-associated exonuclease Cas4 (RecB family)
MNLSPTAEIPIGVGEAGRLSLYAETRTTALNNIIDNDWYREFLEHRDIACDAMERKRGMSRTDALKPKRGNYRRSNPRLVV